MPWRYKGYNNEGLELTGKKYWGANLQISTKFLSGKAKPFCDMIGIHLTGKQQWGLFLGFRWWRSDRKKLIHRTYHNPQELYHPPIPLPLPSLHPHLVYHGHLMANPRAKSLLWQAPFLVHLPCRWQHPLWLLAGDLRGVVQSLAALGTTN